MAERISHKIQQTFAPAHLDVVDESHFHAGHAGAPAGGESHFRVTVVASAFAGLSRVERQRRVNNLLADEFAGGLHALSLVLRTPEEAGA